MGTPRSSGVDLGGTLAVVKPNPISVFIGCIPGLVAAVVVLSEFRMNGVLLLFHPEIELPPGMRPFMWCSLLVVVLLLGLGLRHIFDRAELCQEGFRFLGKAYRYDQTGPITWGHHSQNGLTQFRDLTTMSFRFQGKQVRLKTRYLQDLSYQYHRVYGLDPSTGEKTFSGGSTESNTQHYPRAR